MKGVGLGIRGRRIHLTDDPVVPGAARVIEQVRVESARVASPPGLWRNDDAIDVDKPLVSIPEPLKIDSVIVSILVETDNEGLNETYSSGDERLLDQPGQTVSIQSG